jgi:hypothetical protein
MNRSIHRSMFMRSLKTGFLAIVVCSGLLALGAALAPAQDASAAGAQRSDGQIEMDVVHALDASPALKNDLITAATIQGEVTLAGTVSSDASKKLAESIVKQVQGVTGVHNNLTIGNPQDAQNDPQNGAAQQPPDDDQQQANAQPPAGWQQPGRPPANGQQAPPPDQGQYSQSGPPPNQYPDQGQQGAYPPQGQQAPYPPQQGQYPPPYPPGRPQYGQYPPYPPQQGYNRPPAPAYQPATGPVTIPAGTMLQLRTSEALASKRAKDGEAVQFTLISDVTFGGVLAIPKGATFHGVITEARKAGQLSGTPELALTLTSLDLGGQTYPLNTDEFRVKGPNKAGQTVGNAVGAGLVGTIIGCAVGRGAGCAIGAGAGVAAGTAASAASSGPGVWIPAEALVSFHLKDPVTVNPVSEEEAARLAEGLYQGGPSLYQRGPRRYYPYGPRVYYGYPYYPYPPVYYRPYYMVGGVYYWR